MREIIKESDANSRVTLLEYLKQLHTVEWENFVKDTKILAAESDLYVLPSLLLYQGTVLNYICRYDGQRPFGDEKGPGGSKADDLPFYMIGFKSAAPEFTLRTRIWAR